MNKVDLNRALDVAVLAAEQAGDMARFRFGFEVGTEMKDDRGDLVTEVDRAADKSIVSAIASAFPDHRIYSEELGESGVASPYVWHVDPLDGTNNYALGIPLYGVSISLSHEGRTVLGVVHDSHLQETYTALLGEGAWRNGKPLTTRAAGDFSKSTLSWIQGHAVTKSDETALKLRHMLEAQFKRVTRLWAPSLAWAMLARGDLGAIVLYQSEGEDLYAGVLLAQEAGVRVTDAGGRPVGEWKKGAGPSAESSIPCLAAAPPEHHTALLRLVNQTVGGSCRIDMGRSQ